MLCSLLRDVPIFAGLDDHSLELLVGHAEPCDFPAGAVLAREGETSNCMFIIETGVVRVCKGFGTPLEVELATLGPKDFFGEMCVLDMMPRAATVQAAAPSRVVGISSVAFHHLYKQMPAQYSVLILNIARDLSRRLRRLDEAFAARH